MAALADARIFRIVSRLRLWAVERANLRSSPPSDRVRARLTEMT
jgi:hypothetical protein